MVAGRPELKTSFLFPNSTAVIRVLLLPEEEILRTKTMKKFG